MAGIYDRKMFRMANGGPMPPMDPAMMDPAMMDPAMMGSPQIPPEAMQEADSAFQEVAGEAVAAEIGQEVGRSINNLDSAMDYRDIMNAVWDDNADIEAYRNKLAEVVGWEDADRTPDSVLALVQPTLQLAQIDQGIGALMQEELAEVGELGGGITELATKSAVADGMAAETDALVGAVSNMAPMDRPSMTDDMLMMAEMQGAGPMGQGMV
jgi:hypothetical protein